MSPSTLETVPLLLYLASAVVVGGGIVRALRARKRETGSPGFGTRLRSAMPAFVYLLGTGLLSVGVYLGARLFFTGSPLMSVYLLCVAVMLASMLDLACDILYPLWKPTQIRGLAGPVLAVLLGAAVLAVAFYLGSAPLGGGPAIPLAYPVKGMWRVEAGGQTRLTNYHHGHPTAQNYAVDLVCTSGETEGQAVYAPVDGLVVQAVGELVQGSPEAEGNLIVLRTENGTEIWMAHLKEDSVQVKEGDRVKRGQEIAQCGATGNAAMAHLHIHAEKDHRPVPMVFGPGRRFLVRNDRVLGWGG